MKIPRVDLLEYARPMRSVDWSPDGEQLAVCDDRVVAVLGADRRVIWRSDSNGRVGFGCKVVRFSRDGARLASGHLGQVALWDALSGRLLRVKTIRGSAMDIAWSPDSLRVASTGVESVIFDAESGETVTTLVCSTRLDWPPQGKELVVSGDLYAASSGDRLATLTTFAPTCCRCSKDARHFAAGTSNGLQVWSIPGRIRQFEFVGHEAIVKHVAWHPAGQIVASGSRDSTVRLWSLAEGRELAVLEGHRGAVNSVCFSPDGARLASVSEDMSLQVWDVSVLDAGRSTYEAHGQFRGYVARQAASVGRRAAPRVADRWVPAVREYRGNGEHANGVAICRDGRTAVMGSDDGTVSRINLETGHPVWGQPAAHSESVNELAVSKDGRRVASASRNGEVQVREVSSGRILQSMEGLRRGGWSEFSPSCELLAISRSGGAEIWRVGEERAQVLARDWRLLAWHRSEDLLVVESSEERRLGILTPNGGVVHQFAHGARNPYVIAYLSEGYAVEGYAVRANSPRRRIELWNVGVREPVLTLEGHPETVTCMRWCPADSFLASGGGDSAIRVWNTQTGQEVAKFDLDEGCARQISWAPSGAFLAASLDGDIVRIFDTRELLDPPALAPSSTVGPDDVTPDLRPLPAMLEACSRIGHAVPLSWIDSLLAFWSGGEGTKTGIQALSAHPNVRRLIGLNWPSATRSGLLSLLLHRLPRIKEWEPPAGMSPPEVRSALTDALAGEEIPARAPALPTAAMLEAADRLDERFFTLLEMVGPNAVAADPGLPLRLLAEADKLPPIESARRQLLGLKLHLDEEGAAQGTGQGAERTGIELSGDIRSLLPSQLALPDPVLRAQHVRGELLHRARAGQEPPRLRPTVLVLDVSPPTFGPVESMTRLAAHTVAISLLDAGVPVVLVTAGGRGTLRVLERREDLVEIWTARSQEEADASRSLATARAMAETLRGGALEPVVLVMSQVFFGAGARPDRQSGVRGLFVSYPGSSSRPAFAGSCERWASLDAGNAEELGQRLGELVA